MIDISVIIPMYNSETYIKKCLQSLLSQTMNNFEIIIVDDKSNDNSIEIVKETLENQNIESTILPLEENKGPGQARNEGLKIAKGKYVCFIDSDDFVKEEYLETLLNEAKSSNADIVFCDYINVGKNNEEVLQRDYNFEDKQISNLEYASVCNDGTTRKIIKKEIIDKNNITFPCKKSCEDIEFCIKAALFSNIVKYVDKPLYYYYQRDNSLSNTNHIEENVYGNLFYTFCKYLDLYKIKHSDDDIKARALLDLVYNTTILMINRDCKIKELREHLKKVNKRYKNLNKNYSFKFYPITKKIYLIFAILNMPTMLKLIYKIKNTMYKKNNADKEVYNNGQ